MIFHSELLSLTSRQYAFRKNGSSPKQLFCTAPTFHLFTATVQYAPLSDKMDLLHCTRFSFIHSHSLRRLALRKNGFSTPHCFLIHSKKIFKTLQFTLKQLFCTGPLYHSFTATLQDALLPPKTDLLHHNTFLLDINTDPLCIINPHFFTETLQYTPLSDKKTLIHSQQHFKTPRFLPKRLFCTTSISA